MSQLTGVDWPYFSTLTCKPLKIIEKEHISGQTAIDTNGKSSTADFTSQLLLSIANLEEVIANAGYKNSDITRITMYTTDLDALGQNFGVIQEWITSNNMRIAVTVVEVSKLFETTVVELEAIAAK